jgi:aminoglycoside/choline kinase family phosphotransferase
MSLNAPHPPSPVTESALWVDPNRQALFETWFADIQQRYPIHATSLRMASSDAGFRRYLRVDSQPEGAVASFIIMDAPPDLENCTAFVNVAQLLTAASLKVPNILEWDEGKGFMLLSDLGTHTLLQTLVPDQPPPLAYYLDAVETLIQWQLSSREGVLPAYDRPMLLREMELFPQWYVAQHRQFTLDAAQRKTMEDAFEKIVASNLAWPSVYVHRDFMPRNLMVEDVAPTLSAGASSLPPEGAVSPWGGPAVKLAPTLSTGPSATRLGVLDFQDAVYGPITYDIASLMRDAFVSWDESFCLDVTIRYWERARKAGLPVGEDFGEFYRGVEWMGLQRHLKVAGIFARLSLRDGKPRYLADTPRFIDYIRATCARYIELKPLLRLVERIEGIAVPNAYAFGRV